MIIETAILQSPRVETGISIKRRANMKREEIQKKMEPIIRESLATEPTLTESTLKLLGRLLEAHEEGTSDTLQVQITEEYGKIKEEFDKFKDIFQKKHFRKE